MDGPTKIAVLDDYASNAPPHLKQLPDDLQANLQTDYFPDTLNMPDEQGPKASIERLQPRAVRSLPSLKLLLTAGTRNACINLSAAQKHGVVVAGTESKPNAFQGLDSTNEQTWALILGVITGLAADDASVKSGGWQDGTVVSLAGKTLELLGLGHLGAQCAVTGVLAFGMKVIFWNSDLTQGKADEEAVKRGRPKGSFKATESKEQLFREADVLSVLSVYYVLSDRGRGIVRASGIRGREV